MAGSILVTSMVGLAPGVWLAVWFNTVWKHWLDAKQTILFDEHARIAELLTDFLHEHGRCPTSGQDFTEDGPAQIIAGVKYFQDIQFSPSGRDRCQFTAKLHTPWNPKRDGMDVFYSISPTLGDISCDGFFLHESWICKVSTQNAGK